MNRMKYELEISRGELTDNQILEDIRRVASELETDYISISTYRSRGKYSQTAIQGHFGTWTNALEIAGLRSARTKAEHCRIKDMDYIDDLNRIARHLKKDTVLYGDYKLYGKYSAEYIIKRFSTWDNALMTAGLQPTGMARTKIAEQALFDEIERIWAKLGRPPTSTDIIKGGLSRYSIDTFKRRFGGWRNALEAFVAYANSGEDQHDPEEEKQEAQSLNPAYVPETEIADEPLLKRKHRTSRNPTNRMRYLVFSRDNFKCCACGASPAKDPSVDLVVDHIIPWAKGGETVIDNLQTLCSKCNGGKSDLV